MFFFYNGMQKIEFCLGFKAVSPKTALFSNEKVKIVIENALRKKWAFWGMKSQIYEKVYKIKVKDQTFSYLVLNFYNN